MKLKEITFFAFLMKDIKNDKWLSWGRLKEFCKENQIPHVEELASFKFSETYPTIDELQDMANNAKYDHGRTNAEGIVIRPVSPYRSLAMQKPWWSLKIMNQPYDMKKE
jgi:ATP-dependent RNA circularization protein (DNA/RNA ligase family)